MIKVDIVTSTFNAESYIELFLEKVSNLFNNSNKFELSQIIIVDDGSTDQTIDKIIILKKNSKNKVKIIKLSRNYGQHTALKEGIKSCNSDFCFLLDSDLQEDPNDFFKLYELMSNKKLELVYGKYKKSQSFTSYLFNNFFVKIFNQILEPNVMTIRLMTKKYYKSLNQSLTKNFVLNISVQELGFKKDFCYLNKNTSIKKSNYTFNKKMSLFFNCLTVPNDKVFSYMLIFSFLSMLSVFGYSFYIFSRWLIQEQIQEGFTTVVILISLFGFLAIFFNSLNLIYLSRILNETKKTQDNIIDEIIE